MRSRCSLLPYLSLPAAPGCRPIVPIVSTVPVTDSTNSGPAQLSCRLRRNRGAWASIHHPEARLPAQYAHIFPAPSLSRQPDPTALLPTRFPLWAAPRPKPHRRLAGPGPSKGAPVVASLRSLAKACMASHPPWRSCPSFPPTLSRTQRAGRRARPARPPPCHSPNTACTDPRARPPPVSTHRLLHAPCVLPRAEKIQAPCGAHLPFITPRARCAVRHLEPSVLLPTFFPLRVPV